MGAITLRGMLKLIGDIEKDFLLLDRYEMWKLARWGPQHIRPWEDYFPSQIERTVEGLLRRGWVKKMETEKGTVVQISQEGKKRLLFFDLEKLQSKGGKWDGKWRMVFFDVAEVDRKKRDLLRKYLKKLGLYRMQESVWVGPYPCEEEAAYIREVLDIPHGVKLGLLEKIENEADLKKIFNL
ncbi:MAG: CRISPR-associated endonuclease Cas2 [Patescibacteria group bacterium]